MRLDLRLIGGLLAAILISAIANGADFTPITGWERQLFPSYIIATASMRGPDSVSGNTLGDPRGLLGVEMVSPGDNTPIQVSIQCDEICQRSEFSGILPKKGEAYRICPKMKFRFPALAKIDQAMSASVTYRVKIGAAAEQEQTVTLLVRSINDCPFAVKAGSDRIETSFTFAAYVNEQHPFVDKMLREALNIGMVDKFTGYQSGKPSDAVRQAYALWDLLFARDVRYSNITATVGSAETVACQHVRLIDETVNNSQANCLDGSVLWVSMMRKIGIDAFLILEPGHCYAGFFADADHKICYAIETTLIGDEIDQATLEVPPELSEVIDEETRDYWSFGSFVAAVKTGTERFVKNARHFKDQKQPGYRIIEIGAARQCGIVPIPFTGKEEFLAYDHSARWATEEATEGEETAEGGEETWNEESADETAAEEEASEREEQTNEAETSEEETIEEEGE